MQPDEQPKRGPGRPRKEERPLHKRRRNRSSQSEVSGKRLPVNPETMDFEAFRYRWINDDPARIFHMTQNDDWEIVSNDGTPIVPDNDDMGAAYSKVVGSNPNDGSARRAYLCRKPRKWWEDDQKQKQTDLDKQLEMLRRGHDASGKPLFDYVPDGAISM